MEPTVLIVGAGPTGLALALWLTRAKIPVRIIDKSDGPGETSRAMGVHARTLEFYSQLGVADEVVRRGIEVQHVSVRRAGILQGQAKFGHFGEGLSPFPFMLSFPQDEHERVLIARLAELGVAVERRTRLESFAQENGGVSATLDRDGHAETTRFSYLCGCDGARSTTRDALNTGFPGGTYSHVFFVADAEVSGQALDGGIDICITGQDFCLVLPLRRAGSARLIGIVPDQHTEHVTFEDVAPSVKRNTGLAVEAVNWFSTYRVHHRVAGAFRRDRVFLLGDAAHVHSPVGGQGMNTGIGDAMNLAWKLAAVLQGRAAEAILDTYEPERIAFARKLVGTTDRLFQLMTNASALGRAWRSIGMAHLVPLLFRLKPVPRLAFRAMSQIEIEYRSSRLSSGAAGTLRSGDRLPWVKAAAGDNFVPLKSLDWQVHVYGAAPGALEDLARRRGIPVHEFAWSDAAGTAGLERDALYLVRPDGYIGFAGPAGEVAGLERYLDTWQIRTSAVAILPNGVDPDRATAYL